jgi:ABC-type transporter Mla subunit MlaD
MITEAKKGGHEMTGEEVERTMAFILQQQAQLTATVGQLGVRVDGLAEKVERIADKVDRMAEKIDRNADSVTALLAIAEIHEREITDNREAQSRTDERLNALINTVERYISEGRSGKA